VNESNYIKLYDNRVEKFKISVLHFIEFNQNENPSFSSHLENFKNIRHQLKTNDFWLRYFADENYQIINGAIGVEWENEVFAKFQPPYKKIGSGVYLAEQELLKQPVDFEKTKQLLLPIISELNKLQTDSVKKCIQQPSNFYKANRLYLLNLASIYSTGFECNIKTEIIPELLVLMESTQKIYTTYNQSYPDSKLSNEFLKLHLEAIQFVKSSSKDYQQFNHYLFIKNYVEKLFAINTFLIQQYKFNSIKNIPDFSINSSSKSLFDKNLIKAQRPKGIYESVTDSNLISEIKHIGKLLFNDPILSGNNKRSCAACHKSEQYFTDTTIVSALDFSAAKKLPRNTPSLVNTIHQQMLMLDGKHSTLHNQAIDVITNPNEMNSDATEVVKKIMSCKIYQSFFMKMKKATHRKKEISIEDIISAITFYYADFSFQYSSFDNSILQNKKISDDAIEGFNIFMSKAQCATCHFPPTFSGVKAPFNNSEFEVIGVPSDTQFSKLSNDEGRYNFLKSDDAKSSFRTPTLRNSSLTKPYMHNAVFNTLDEVINFYNIGGAAGKKIKIENQTLSSDSLHLTKNEIQKLKLFLESLTENLPTSIPITELPSSKNKQLNQRKIGGVY
jgi:cytochrome c peroxidase